MMWEEKPGETFLEKSFPRTPFKRLLDKGQVYS